MQYPPATSSRPKPLLILLVLAAFGFAGCELVNNESAFENPTIPRVIKYSTSVQPVLDSTCTMCHGAAVAEAGLRLDSWSAVFDGSDFGEAVIPFQPARSRLMRMMVDAPVPHPREIQAGADTLDAEELQILREWITSGGRNDNLDVAADNATDLLYVTDPDDASVAVINRTTGNVIRVVDLVDEGFSPGALPMSIAVEPDGSAWYVSLAGANAIAKFSRSNQLIATASFTAPGPIVLHPTENILYVSRARTITNPPLSIGKVDRSSLAVTEIPVVFPRPHALGIDSGGEYVFVGSFGQNQLTRISVSTDSTSFIPVDGATHGMAYSAVSPVTDLMITTGATSASLLVHDVSNPDSVELTGTLPINAAPTYPVFLPGGDVAFIPSATTNSVSRVTMDPLEVDEVILGDGLATPSGAVVSDDGALLYVANRNTAGPGSYTPRFAFSSGGLPGTVVVINTATNEIVRVIEVGQSADGLATR